MHTKITIAIGALAICVSAALATESSVPHLKADQVHALGFDGFGVTVAEGIVGQSPTYTQEGL